MLGKYANVFAVLFALIVLLAMLSTINDVYGKASPVTCVVITNPVESKLATNYIVTVNPQYARVIPGSSTTFDVTVLSKGNATDLVSLDIVGLPDGINTVFNPVKGNTDFTSKLTISVDEMICPGIYTPEIIAKNTNLQLADFKLEVASTGSVRKVMENEYAELSSKIDKLQSTMNENHPDIFAGYVAILLTAIIGIFLLGTFALYVLLRQVAKSSSMSTGNDVKLHNIIDLLRQLVETSRKQTEIKNEVGQVTRKEQPDADPKVGDVWYAYCTTCGLRTEHSRDYEGVFCTRCGNRAS